MSRRAALDSTLDPLVHELEQMLVDTRADLPRALNGRTIAPSSGYAAQVLRDIGQGRSGAVRQILAVLITAAHDGDRGRSFLFLKRLEAIVRAAGKVRPVPSLSALNREEEVRAHELNILQIELAGRENDVEFLRAQERAARNQAAISDRMADALADRIVQLEVQQGGVAVRRPGSRIATAARSARRGLVLA